MSKYQKYIDTSKDNLEIYNYDIKSEEIHIYFERAEFVVLPYKDAT